MNLQLSRWGNSLAVRLPSAMVRQLGLQEGASLSAELTEDGALRLAPEAPIQPAHTRTQLLEQIRSLHAKLPPTQPVARDTWSRY